MTAASERQFRIPSASRCRGACDQLRPARSGHAAASSSSEIFAFDTGGRPRYSSAAFDVATAGDRASFWAWMRSRGMPQATSHPYRGQCRRQASDCSSKECAAGGYGCAPAIAGGSTRANMPPRRAVHGGPRLCPDLSVLVVDPSEETREVLRTAFARRGTRISRSQPGRTGARSGTSASADGHRARCRSEGQLAGLAGRRLRPAVAAAPHAAGAAGDGPATARPAGRRVCGKTLSLRAADP